MPDNRRGPLATPAMHFTLLSEISAIQTFASGSAIRDLARLRHADAHKTEVTEYGLGRWRKCKGFALIQLGDGPTHRAELHWYEATGFGRKEFKIKHFVD